jgi:uncharacterized protein (DUF1330 family)
MDQMHSTEPTELQLRELAEADQDSAFDMVNLLKYRDVAKYDSAVENAKGRSGREAYNEYAKVVLPKIRALGGSLAYRGKCDHLFVGDESQAYDELIVVRYPCRKAYLEMFRSADYQSAIKHRKAGLEFRILHASTAL